MRQLRDLLRLAGSVLIGQLAVIGFGVADTVMLGHFSTTANLATLSLGQAIYITLFVSLSGVTQALLPTLGRAHGAGSSPAVGAAFRQGLWLAAGLSVLGIGVLLWPRPLLALTGQTRDSGVDLYLQILAFGLPAALAFRVHAALSQAISKPLLVATLQIGGLALKLGLNAVFLLPAQFGLHGLSSLGATGCAAATVLTQWSLLAVALMQHRRSAGLRPYEAFRHWERPSWAAQRHLLRLGGPIGLSLLVEVSAFTFMALFIARLGNTVLAGHQIAANFATVLYMLPLSISIATGSVVAQHLGAGQRTAARHTAWSGVGMAALLSVGIGILVWLERSSIIDWYTSDTSVQAVADHLFLFIALYQLFDAVQSSSAFVLRSYHIAALPSALYALSLWGIGLGGGYLLAFNTLGISPPALQGAAGFWMGNTTGLAVAASSFALLLWRIARKA
ncbi:multidrug resistance protein NorM [mine drainage metagenome]|uniref:Multidrug resistance protein NorM n=1 Tax=mine drainage metagenome TaxID=410659 RepID=A0A1J5PUB7_9ZZZZ